MVNFSIFDFIGNDNPVPILESLDGWTQKKKLQVQQQPTKSNHELTAAQRQTKTQTEYFSVFDSIGL